MGGQTAGKYCKNEGSRWIHYFECDKRPKEMIKLENQL